MKKAEFPNSRTRICKGILLFYLSALLFLSKICFPFGSGNQSPDISLMPEKSQHGKETEDHIHLGGMQKIHPVKAQGSERLSPPQLAVTFCDSKF